MRESAKSFGSTVKKKIEKAETIISILKIIAIAKEREINRVFKIIIKTIKNDKPRTLFIHCLINFPNKIIGIKLIKIKNRGIISLKSSALIVYIIEKMSFALGSI